MYNTYSIMIFICLFAYEIETDEEMERPTNARQYYCYINTWNSLRVVVNCLSVFLLYRVRVEQVIDHSSPVIQNQSTRLASS